ncbi:FYVE-domain-containing protein [Neoconidiobolus thromboides FSU 785]|nr:FYVE-domain-containing protein [Neoconidiobolus thromboides FSU 785]
MSQTDPVYFNPNFSTSSPIFTRLINSNKNSNPISLQSQFWEIDSDVSGCRSCQKPFSLFVRRHHCRRCGLIYCDSCSSARIDLKNYHLTYDLSGSINSEEEAPTPQRVCDPCYKIIRSGPRLPPVEIPVLLKRTDSQASILTECPVCSKRLIAISANKEDHETHINACLEGNSFDGTNNSSRYLVFTLEEDSPMLRQECTICLEEFKQADRIARLNCLCCFHRSCIQEWFFQNTSCPIHFH